MTSLALTTRRGPKKLVLAANTVVTAYHTTIPIPTVAKASLPTANIIAPYGKGKTNGDAVNSLSLALFGVGSAGNQPTMLVVGWQRVAENIDLWFPTALAEVTGTMGANTATFLGATQRFCDVLTLTASVGLEGTSGVNRITQLDGIVDMAILTLDVFDFEYVSVHFKKGTATSANALYSAF